MLTVTNWNLARAKPGTPRGDRVAAQLAISAADIYFLTESHKGLAPVAGFHPVHSAQPGPSHSPDERFSSIWTRSDWQLECLNSSISDPERCAAARVSHPEFGGILLYCCVLPWKGDRWAGNESKGGVAFAGALELYRKDWRELKRLHPDDIFLLAGDFNQSLVDRHFYASAHQQELLEETLAQEDFIALTAYENDPVSRDSFPQACIDHICINADSKPQVQSCERWPTGAKPDKSLSDHFGITVVMTPV